MHISESVQCTNTILTKCSKMTEEKHRRHGINGNVDGALKEDSSKNSYVQGGRLKFFKDGKFILELERAREGERVAWVSVPRKTFWPPQGTAASTPSYRQESSTSLSVSDDNSSIQSSPWQRDHSWKQMTPRRNQSVDLAFVFWCPKHKRPKKRINTRKYRRFYSSFIIEDYVVCSERTKIENVCNNINNNNNINNKDSKSQETRRALLTIIQNLIDKINYSSTPSPRPETVVSPRKRFLREMEKDKLPIEDNCQKRSRNKNPQINNNNNNNSTISTTKLNSPIKINGTSEDLKPQQQQQQKNNSYSITSLLADDRSIKRSPNNSPSHFNTTASQTQYCASSASDDRWYSESVDRLRSIELSHADKRVYPPYTPHSYVPSYMFPYSLPPYYSPTMYGRNYLVPPMYHTPSLQHIPVRHDAPSCSWTATSTEPPRDVVDNTDDNVTDMPLNLSKHAG